MRMNLRSNTYNEGNVYSALPVFRQPVVPGQRVDRLDLNVKLITAPMTKTVITPFIANVYLFYVPNRLVWDQWVDFIAGDQDAAATVVPTTTTAWQEMFERSGTHSALFRRAYKLVYNQFFGDDSEANGDVSWYDDITLDTETTIKRLRTTDQLNSRAGIGTEQATDTYVAAVSGTTATIQLRDFRRALEESRRKSARVGSGDKYVDVMRGMGVDLDWRVQNAPEYLGGSTQMFAPTLVRATDGANLGEYRSIVQGSVNLSVENKRFSEHGYIVGIAALRVASMISTRPSPVDTFDTTVDDFYTGRAPVGMKNYPIANFGGTSGLDGDVLIPEYAHLKLGQNLMGRFDGLTEGYTAPYSIGSAGSVIYPYAANYGFSDTELSGRDMAVQGSAKLVGTTPVGNPFK